MASEQNHLIELLPRSARARLLALCEPVQLVLADVLCDTGQTTRHVYFPIDGFISLLTLVEGSPGLEVGMVGREGMVGVAVALGAARSPSRALVQGAGTAWRVGAGDFRREVAASPALKRALDLYACVLMMQLTTSAACLRFHHIGPRLARWLLMSQDRAHADRFRVTQEFIATMLGVRRVGVTTAASVMQRSGLIGYHRGDLTVLDRAGLEATSCSCYAADRRAYADLIH